MKWILMVGALVVSPIAHAATWNSCNVPGARAPILHDFNQVWHDNHFRGFAVAVANITTLGDIKEDGYTACHMTIFFGDGSSVAGTLAEVTGERTQWVRDRQN